MSDVDKTAERIYWLLTDALSETREKREHAEKGLRDAEEGTDFFASLAMICTSSDDQAPARVRWLASVVGKNAVARSWRRRTRPNGVTEDERAFVRESLLGALGEPHTTIAAQIAVWIARIARIDYPAHWARLIPTLCTALTTPRPDAPHFTLHTLRVSNELFEVLASRRLAQYRRALYVASPPAFAAIRTLFVSHLRIMVEQHTANNVAGARASFEVIDLSLKCLRLLVMHGYERIDDASDVHELFADVLKHPDLFLRGADGGAEHELRLSLLAVKLVARTFERHPVYFHLFLPRFLDTYCGMLINYNASTADDGICAQAASFIRSVLISPDFNYCSTTIAEFRQNGAHAAEQGDPRIRSRHIVLSFFSEARVDALIQSMLTKIFVLREHEVESWVDDPEAFVQDEEVADWGTQSLRHECDEIFKTLLVRDKRRIAPKVIALAESVPLSEPLLRDACYRAVGNAVYDLEGLFNFEPWLHGQLGPILQANVGDNVGERILQSRAAWLVGQFVAQLTRDARAAVYGLLVNLMTNPNGDRVVALTSANSMYSLAEDMGFRSDDFLPHLSVCVTATFKLLLSSDTLETRRSLLSLAAQLVSKSSRDAVITLLPALSEALPIVWQMNQVAHGTHAQTISSIGGGDTSSSKDIGGDANMLKIALVVFLVSLVQKAGRAVTLNEPLHRFVHDAILFGTDMKRDGAGVYLCEDACELWRLLIACSAEYTESMDKMFSQVPVILNCDASRLKEICRVVESYALLGREQFLRSHGGEVSTLLSDVMRNSRDRGCIAAAEIVDVLLKQFPVEGVQFLSPLLQYIFESAVRPGAVSSVLSAAYVALIARATVLNIEGVEALVLRSDAARVDALFGALLQRLDVVHRHERRRGVILALCGLAARYAAAEQVRAHMPSILDAAVQVLAGTSRGKHRQISAGEFANAIARRGERALIDAPAANIDMAGEESLPEDDRRRTLDEHDPAKRVRIGDAVSSMISALRACGDGDAAYQKVMHDAGPDVIKQLERLVNEESSGRERG